MYFGYHVMIYLKQIGVSLYHNKGSMKQNKYFNKKCNLIKQAHCISSYKKNIVITTDIMINNDTNKEKQKTISNQAI